MTYTILPSRRFDFTPLRYYTEQGCQVVDKDDASNKDLWDVNSRPAITVSPSGWVHPNAWDLKTWLSQSNVQKVKSLQ